MITRQSQSKSHVSRQSSPIHAPWLRSAPAQFGDLFCFLRLRLGGAANRGVITVAIIKSFSAHALRRSVTNVMRGHDTHRVQRWEDDRGARRKRLESDKNWLYALPGVIWWVFRCMSAILHAKRWFDETTKKRSSLLRNVVQLIAEVSLFTFGVACICIRLLSLHTGKILVSFLMKHTSAIFVW